MKIDFYTLPKDQGILCEHCGTYIRNVFVIKFNDGFVLKCGSECFKKIQKQTNISEYGIKLLTKLLNKLKDYDKTIQNWESWQTPEDAEEDKCFQRIEDSRTWRIRTQEEFDKEKNLMITYISARIKQIQQEIEEKFKNIKLKEVK